MDSPIPDAVQSAASMDNGTATSSTPHTAPAATSVGQCTPTYTRLAAISTARPIHAAANDGATTISVHAAAAPDAACPDGNDVVRWRPTRRGITSGRFRRQRCFNRPTAMPAAPRVNATATTCPTAAPATIHGKPIVPAMVYGTISRVSQGLRALMVCRMPTSSSLASRAAISDVAIPDLEVAITRAVVDRAGLEWVDGEAG